MITALFLISCQTNKDKAEEHYLRARKLKEAKDIPAASAEIELAIQLDSLKNDYLVMKALIQAEAENYEQAISMLEAVKAKASYQDSVIFFLGEVYFDYATYSSSKLSNQERYLTMTEKALLCYNEVIEHNMRYFEAYRGKIRTLHNLSRHNEALVAVQSAMSLFPDSAILRGYRGIEKISLGDLQGAKNDLDWVTREAANLDSTELSVMFRFRGMIADEEQKWQSAIDYYSHAIRFKSNNSYALMNRALSYLKLKDTVRACDDFRSAADLGYLEAYDLIKQYCKD